MTNKLKESALFKTLKPDKVKSKKGLTLVELIVTIAIFVIVLVGVLAGITTSQTIMTNNNLKEKASSQAQTITDEIMGIVKGVKDEIVEGQDISSLLSVSSAKRIKEGTEFNEKNGNVQYKINYTNKDNVKGYLIQVAVFYDGEKYVQNTGFSPVEVIE